MTTATETALDPRAELAALGREIAELKTKLAVEKSALDTLTREKTATAEKIASGALKASAASAIERRMEEAQAGVSGLESILARKSARVTELRPIVSRIEAEERQASRRSIMDACCAIHR